jgi:hypothetical protein
MRTSLIVASFGAALAALTTGISPSNAQSAAEAYPYCLMGRGGGSTTCYFKSRAECGNGCIDNPGYVGDVRARAILAAIGTGGEGGRARPKANSGSNSPNPATAIGVTDARVRASAARGNDFDGWPTGYLVNRFGDRQAQGRF